MQRVLPWIGLFALIIALNVSCENPADNVPAATVTEAQPVPAPATTPDPAPTETSEPEAEPMTEEPASEPEPEPEPAAGPLNLSFTDNSMITFQGSKVTGTHSGGFVDFTGSIVMADGTFDTARIIIDIDMTSLFSDDKVLTDTLKGDRFFDVEKFPTSKFVSTGIAKTADGYTITGNLEMHGVTKSISFPTTVSTEDGVLTSDSEFSINRFQWEIEDTGLKDDFIRKEVVIRFEIEAA